MRTLILAAGRGSRLQPLTATIPKALVPLNGVPLLDRLLEAVSAGGATGPVTAVTGYRGDKIIRPGVHNLRHATWASTTMVGSLLAATDDLLAGEDVLIVYGDIVVEPRVLAATLQAEPAWDVAMPVNCAWRALWSARMSDPLSDVECLRFDAHARVTQIGGRPRTLDDVQAQYMGIVRLSARGAHALVRFAEDTNAATSGVDMTAMLSDWIAAGQIIHAVPVRGGWLEVDTIDDHQLYQRLAAAGELDRFCVLP